jgi:hypothetical protein
MLKKYEPHIMLLSPRVAGLLDDDTARLMAKQLDAMSTQEGHPLDLPHGSARLWGVEIEDSANDNRTYRVAFVVEEESKPPRRTYLSILAIEEQSDLADPPNVRAQRGGWRSLLLEN